ncbi:MAG: carboxyl-terminal processing protease, partial [Verrucomicrobiales bacterium]
MRFVSCWIAILLALNVSLWAEEKTDALSLKTFDEVWQTIQDSYYDPEFGDLDWKAVGEKYRPRALKAQTAAQLRPVLSEMLGELGQSHFGVIPGSRDLEKSVLIQDDVGEAMAPPEPEPEQQQAIEEQKQERAGPSGDYSGIHLRMHDEQVIISRVDVGSPAAKSGLKAGPTVTRIGDLKVEAFLKRAGETASKGFSKDFFVLQVLGELLGEPSDGDRQSITVLNPQEPRKEITHAYRPIQYPGKMSVAAANMESMPIRYEEKRFTFPKGEVLYLGFNIFLPEVMRKLRESMKNRGEGVVGLIVDVRGNPGGLGVMANGLAGILTDKQFSLGQMKMRAGVFNFVAFPQRGAFLGPVVILVDGMSASTSEIFAAGMQEAGRAHVVGRRTMGA